MNDAPPDLSNAFFRHWVDACARLGIDPIDLIRVSYSESGGVRASAHNPNGNASGLIQFMPDTLRRLGWSAGDAAFRQLSAEEQVSWVERYYRPYAVHCVSDALCYVATFLPALLPAAHAAGEGAAGFVLCGMRGPLAWAYGPNKAFDRDHKGSITVGDLAKQLEIACRGARYDAIVHRVRLALGEAAEPPPPPPDTEPEIVHPDVPLEPRDVDE